MLTTRQSSEIMKDIMDGLIPFQEALSIPELPQSLRERLAVIRRESTVHKKRSHAESQKNAKFLKISDSSSD